MLGGGGGGLGGYESWGVILRGLINAHTRGQTLSEFCSGCEITWTCFRNRKGQVDIISSTDSGEVEEGNN